MENGGGGGERESCWFDKLEVLAAQELNVVVHWASGLSELSSPPVLIRYGPLS